jgi:hypothetical protein
MFASTATVPKNALTTAQLSKDELVQLYQLTRSTWLTPIAALSQAEQLELAYVTLAQFPWVQPPTNLPTGYNKSVVKRWADREEEDDALPELPASWFNR